MDLSANIHISLIVQIKTGICMCTNTIALWQLGRKIIDFKGVEIFGKLNLLSVK
jgi:hypothetical protein